MRDVRGRLATRLSHSLCLSYLEHGCCSGIHTATSCVAFVKISADMKMQGDPREPNIF